MDDQEANGGRTGITVGVVTPHLAAGPEVELPEMTAGRVAVVVERIRPDDPEALDRGAARFGDGSVDAVAYASTMSGYALGQVAETALVERLRGLCGVPVVASAASAVDALRVCGARRVALIHPPWFEDVTDALGVAYFRDQGFEIVLAKATDLPDDPREVRAEDVVDRVGRDLGEEVDAMFFAGNGFRAAAAIEELERRTGLVVLEANQVLLWSILGATESTWDIAGYGRLFRPAPPTTR